MTLHPDGDDPARRWPLSGRVVAMLAVALVLPAAIVALLAHVPRNAVAVALVGTMAVLAIVGFVLQRHVALPLARLQRLVEAAGRGDPGVADHDDGGRFTSREMQALSDSVVRMLDAVQSHSRDLQAARADQQRLTREVHHRVKNSLQIISSLLALHARGPTTTEIASAYAAMQARVAALTVVHRWSLDEDRAGGVDLRAMLGDLAAAVEASLALPHTSPARIGTAAVAAVTVTANAAVPIAFAITELASIAADAGREGATAMVIAAWRTGDTVGISLASPAFVGRDWLADHGSAPSTRIVHGMVRQLGGALRHDPAAGAYAIEFAEAAG